ncbi:uncharacterized protein LOC123499063 [Portunus trituberculatus]|uniref:uncharacterized protein LOC123499063 n=1 Tax=Portunus trituberculatus TaxID=210409 RepID=UPI001E1CDF5A|nr:uncharacterized protein LOC123499063 [Portunus trituberculatus]
MAPAVESVPPLDDGRAGPTTGVGVSFNAPMAPVAVCWRVTCLRVKRPQNFVCAVSPHNTNRRIPEHISDIYGFNTERQCHTSPTKTNIRQRRECVTQSPVPVAPINSRPTPIIEADSSESENGDKCYMSHCGQAQATGGEWDRHGRNCSATCRTTESCTTHNKDICE